MNKKILSSLICAFLCVTLLSACKSGEENTVPVSVATNVSVYEVGKTDIASTVSYTGTLEPGESVSISAKVGALARSVNADEGDYVSAGSVILSLDKTDLNNAYRQSQAAYNQSLTNYNREKLLFEGGSNLTLAKQSYNDAKNAYERVKSLYDMGGASKVELDGAYTALVSAEENLKTVTSTSSAALDAARAALESAQVSVDIALNALNNATITAPISGYVSVCNVSEGQLVNPGVELFRIANTKMVDAKINVTETVIPYMQTGTEATVSVTSAKLEGIKGIITSVNPVKDQMTGLYSIKISIDNEDGELKAGMLCDVELVLSKLTDIIKIPSEALINSGNEYFVYIAKDDKKAEKVKVTLGISDENYTEIVSGISNGDRVIVSGKDYLSEKNNDIKITEEYK